MFERFNPAGTVVLVLAQDEARLMRHDFIGTEHILLGLIREGEAVGGFVLKSFGVDLVTMRVAVGALVPPGAVDATNRPPFTPRVKKLIELSLRESLQLGHNYIGTEHLLLALIREGEGVGARILVKLGMDLSVVRAKVIEVLSGYGSGAPDIRVIVPSLVAQEFGQWVKQFEATIGPLDPDHPLVQICGLLAVNSG